MNCQTCGVRIDPGMLFCPNCGAKQATTGATTRVSPVEEPATEPSYDTPDIQPSGSGPRMYAAPDAIVPPITSPPDAPVSYGQPTPAYAPTGYGMAAPLPTSTAATVSLIFGILSYVALPFVGAIVAIVAGHMAKNEIRRANGTIGGGRFATAGLVLGYLHFAIIVLLLCAAAGFLVVGIAASQNQ